MPNNLLISSLNWKYILPVVISIVLIKLFYRIFRNTWPEMYFSTSDYTSLFISVSPTRYFSFTLLPTMFISALIISLFHSNYQIVHLSTLGFLIGLIHSITGNGVAFIKLIANKKSVHSFFNKYFQLSMHLMTIILLTFFGFVGGVISNMAFFSIIIPTIQGIVDNLWSALFASILTVLFYRLYLNKITSSEDVINKSKTALSGRLVKYIREESIKNNANDKLILAICIVENIQRPPWVRKLEKVKSIVFKKGTYGIMQVASTHYIDDFQSIKIGTNRFFKNTADQELSHGDFESLLSNYNQDSRFIDLVRETYWNLSPRG